MRYYRIRQGISKGESSQIIGRHFPEIQDRLTNLIELAESDEKSELLLASIEQRSDKLKAVPFHKAVEFSDLWNSVKFGIAPIFVFLIIALSGSTPDLLKAFPRVANYATYFDKPAPFSFQILNKTLDVLENQSFILKINTSGSVKPERILLVLEDKEIVMEDKLTHFEHTFQPPLQSQSFYLKANNVRSKQLLIKALPVPSIEKFTASILFPPYLNKQNENVQGNGNITIPEGSRVIWKIEARNADELIYSTKDSNIILQEVNPESFELDLTLYTSQDYTITSKNAFLSESEKLNYHIEVIPDKYPKIELVRDSVMPQANSFVINGIVSDDYGLSELSAILQNNSEPADIQNIILTKLEGTLSSFGYNFPDGFEWTTNNNYTLFFQVRDNDGNKGGKTTLSEPIAIQFADADEIEQKRLKQQNDLIENIKKVFDEKQKLEASWNSELNKNKQNSQLNYRDKNNLKEILQRQEKQEQLMGSFSRELLENLNSSPIEDENTKMLQERLERQEIEAKKNSELALELDEVLNKIDKEELQKRIEELSKSQQNNKRNLEQILELTKKYYVTQAAQNLANILKNHSDEQFKLSETSTPIMSNLQDSLNNEFQSIKEQLKELDRLNQELSRPIEWKRNSKMEGEVEKLQQNAANELKTQNPDLDSSSKAQKSASRKLKDLAVEIENSLASSGGAEQDAEDAETLRQILDNLISFSLEQEKLLTIAQQQRSGNGLSSGTLLKQKELLSLFRHVDDSLFSLSLRRVEISEPINQNITDIYYNLEKAINHISENQWMQGAASQQYAITGSNELGALLAKILDNIQESLSSGGGKGTNSESQLPDIIQSQEELQKQIENLSNGSNEKNSSGKDQNDGKEGKEGEGINEGDFETLFEIYKEQAQIRQALEKQLQNLERSGGKELLKSILSEMEQIEDDILNYTSAKDLQNRFAQLQFNLLKLQNAELEQGQLQERKGETFSRFDFTPNIQTPKDIQKNDKKSIEILNRQALPLRRFYKEKVRTYFSTYD